MAKRAVAAAPTDGKDPGDGAPDAEARGVVDAEAVGPVLAPRLNLAQGELHETLERLYSGLDACERERRSLEQDNTQLRAMRERERCGWDAERVRLRQEARVARQELLRLQQEQHKLQSLQEETNAEVEQMREQVEEKNRALAEMKQVVFRSVEENSSTKNDKRIAGPRELQSLADDFTRREREIRGHVDHVQAATTSLQKTAKELAQQIQQFEREVATLREQSAEHRAFMETHSSPGASPHSASRSSEGSAERIPNTSDQNRTSTRLVARLEQDNAPLTIDQDVLRARCGRLMTDRHEFERRATKSVGSDESLRELVAKYETAGVDGTEIIEALQDSLATVCRQLTAEREGRVRAVTQVARELCATEEGLRAEVAQQRQSLEHGMVEQFPTGAASTFQAGCTRERLPDHAEYHAAPATGGVETRHDGKQDTLSGLSSDPDGPYHDRVD